jgi:hypothetical protein
VTPPVSASCGNRFGLPGFVSRMALPRPPVSSAVQSMQQGQMTRTHARARTRTARAWV